jgi:hypothetical protein
VDLNKACSVLPINCIFIKADLIKHDVISNYSWLNKKEREKQNKVAARSMTVMSEGSADRGGQIHGMRRRMMLSEGGDMELPSCYLRFIREPDP